MKINDRYEIRVVLLEMLFIDDSMRYRRIDNIYNNLERFKREHPFSSYKFGFVVYDTENGCVPEECNEWNDSPEEAIFDYEENCVHFKDTVVDQMRKGRDNHGLFNSGLGNSGDSNSGNRNSEYISPEYVNSGYRNSGHMNSGYMNSGNMNSGNMNLGHRNSGFKNSGDMNSGHMNFGERNSGIANKCNLSNGVFCNEDDTNIRIFNKPSGMSLIDFYESRYWRAMCNSEFNLTEWICYTGEEKATDPEKEKTGGYLKVNSYEEAWDSWWADLSEEDKQIIQEIPNFDAVIFKDITGITV